MRSNHQPLKDPLSGGPAVFHSSRGLGGGGFAHLSSSSPSPPQAGSIPRASYGPSAQSKGGGGVGRSWAQEIAGMMNTAAPFSAGGFGGGGRGGQEDLDLEDPYAIPISLPSTAPKKSKSSKSKRQKLKSSPASAPPPDASSSLSPLSRIQQNAQPLQKGGFKFKGRTPEIGAEVSPRPQAEVMAPDAPVKREGSLTLDAFLATSSDDDFSTSRTTTKTQGKSKKYLFLLPRTPGVHDCRREPVVLGLPPKSLSASENPTSQRLVSVVVGDTGVPQFSQMSSNEGGKEKRPPSPKKTVSFDPHPLGRGTKDVKVPEKVPPLYELNDPDDLHYEDDFESISASGLPTPSTSRMLKRTSVDELSRMLTQRSEKDLEKDKEEVKVKDEWSFFPQPPAPFEPHRAHSSERILSFDALGELDAALNQLEVEAGSPKGGHGGTPKGVLERRTEKSIHSISKQNSAVMEEIVEKEARQKSERRSLNLLSSESEVFGKLKLLTNADDISEPSVDLNAEEVQDQKDRVVSSRTLPLSPAREELRRMQSTEQLPPVSAYASPKAQGAMRPMLPRESVKSIGRDSREQLEPASPSPQPFNKHGSLVSRTSLISYDDDFENESVEIHPSPRQPSVVPAEGETPLEAPPQRAVLIGGQTGDGGRKKGRLLRIDNFDQATKQQTQKEEAGEKREGADRERQYRRLCERQRQSSPSGSSEERRTRKREICTKGGKDRMRANRGGLPKGKNYSDSSSSRSYSSDSWKRTRTRKNKRKSPRRDDRRYADRHRSSSIGIQADAAPSPPPGWGHTFNPPPWAAYPPYPVPWTPYPPCQGFHGAPSYHPPYHPFCSTAPPQFYPPPPSAVFQPPPRVPAAHGVGDGTGSLFESGMHGVSMEVTGQGPHPSQVMLEVMREMLAQQLQTLKEAAVKNKKILDGRVSMWSLSAVTSQDYADLEKAQRVQQRLREKLERISECESYLNRSQREDHRSFDLTHA